MALYFDSFEIQIKINGLEYEEDPTKYSFSISDSIHSLFSRCSFSFDDATGLMQEYLMDIEGFKYEVIYGFKDETISSKYVVTTSKMTELLNQRYFSGVINVELLHDYFDFQEIKSESYKQSISDIITTLVNDYNGFDQVNITPTQCNTYFIQPLITDSKFISSILLPNSYSRNSKDSPYFCYIGNDNSFNFKNYKDLADTETKSVVTLKYTNETNDEPDRNVILDIKRLTEGSKKHKKLRNRYVFQQSQEDGSLVEIEDDINSYPLSINDLKKIPIIKNSKKSGSINLLNKETKDIGLKECYQGQQINSMKNSLFIEKLLLTIQLNTTLNSGNLITIEIPSPISKTNDELSNTWSGNYLIEKSTHTWDGKSKNGYTQLVVSRKHIKVSTNNYLIESNLTT